MWLSVELLPHTAAISASPSTCGWEGSTRLEEGMTCSPTAMPSLCRTMEVWGSVVGEGGTTNSVYLARGKRSSCIKQLLVTATGSPPLRAGNY